MFDADGWLAAEARLQAVQHGVAQPAGASELLKFADVCYPYKNSPAAATRFHMASFALAPPPPGRLVNAAGSAVLAADGHGADALTIDATERTRFRKLALQWLQTALPQLSANQLQQVRQARNSPRFAAKV